MESVVWLEINGRGVLLEYGRERVVTRMVVNLNAWRDGKGGMGVCLCGFDVFLKSRHVMSRSGACDCDYLLGLNGGVGSFWGVCIPIGAFCGKRMRGVW